MFVRVSVAAACASAIAFSAADAAVPGNVLMGVPRVAGSVDLGRAPSDEPVSFAATLVYRNEAQLERLADLQSDPSSPVFGHFLSNEQFNATYAPSAADYAFASAYLRRSGFSVTGSYANRSVIDATGTVAAAERTFGTTLHRVWQRGFGVRIVHVAPIRLPVALAGIVSAIAGIDTVALVRPAFARAPSRQVAPALAPAAGPPLYGPVSTITGLAGFGPLAFSQGYDLPVQHVRGGHPVDGSGRTSGVVIDADFVDSDLRTFLKYFNVKRTGPATVRIAIDGGPPTGDRSPDSVETTLDVETIVSNAPGTALVVYEFPDFTNLKYITDAYNAVVNDNRVDTANSSFGGCETNFPTVAEAWDRLALQGAAKGITFHASTGDGGSDPCGSGENDVEAPASSPHFAAIGGTTLTVTSKGDYTSETAWNSDNGATGGGVSMVFPLPSWQANLPNVITSGRNLPDVAFDADPNTGAAFYYEGTWNSPYDPLGGTSLSSPIYGAAVTEIDEAHGRRSGLEAVALYRFLKAHGYKGPLGRVFFHDIVSGCNGIGGGGYCAMPGFDQVSGIGSVDWWHL